MLAMLWTVAAIASDPPPVYTVENTGADCTPPPLPTVNQLPSIVRLPNPFEFADGQKTVNSFDDWTCRRAEIKAEIENYEIGVKPNSRDSIPATVSATYTASNNMLTVTISRNNKTVVLTSKVVMPNGIGPFPVIIGMDFPTGSLPATVFNGCIQIQFTSSQVTQSDISPKGGPFYDMFPELSANGQYSAWAWGVSRLIDGIELVKDQMNADVNHIGVTGCSYAGKMALFAGAFDERIALTIAQESGGGGTASWRVSETLGSVENLESTDYTWFMQSLKDNFGGQVDKLPYDHHELIAMIAPRAFLALGNDIQWLADESGYVSCMAAKEVYKFMGVEDRIGFDLTGGHNHCAPPTSQVNSATAFVQKYLLGIDTVNTSIAITPYKDDWQFWISDWADVKEPSVPLEQKWTEAESESCVSVGSNLTVVEDSTASNGAYVTGKISIASGIPDVSHIISVPFQVANNRDFHIWFRMSHFVDSCLLVKIDNGPYVPCGTNTNGEWEWVNVLNPTLLTGSHTMNIAFLYNDTKLDKIYITNDSLNQAPTGMGGDETSCIPVPTCYIFDFESGNIDGWVKQNPGKEISITQEDVHSGCYALKMTNGSGTSAWSVQAFAPPAPVSDGHTYNVTFWVRAVGGGGRGRISTTGTGQLGGQYWADFTVGDTWQQIVYNNVTAKGNSVQLSFDMGYVANETYYIDDIVFEDITAAKQPAVSLRKDTCNAVPANDMVLNEWNAGDVAVGENLQSGKFELRNIGTDVLQVTGTTELSAPWSVTPDLTGLALGAGQVQEFTFTYTPVAEDVSDMSFDVHTNAGDASIELKGSGIKTGITNVEKPVIKIFSPAQGKINVTAPDNSNVKIIDILGRTKTSTLNHSPLEISVFSGVYVVSVETGKEMYNQKLVVR